VNSAPILVLYGNGLKGTGVGSYYESWIEIIIIWLLLTLRTLPRPCCFLNPLMDMETFLELRVSITAVSLLSRTMSCCLVWCSTCVLLQAWTMNFENSLAPNFHCILDRRSELLRPQKVIIHQVQQLTPTVLPTWNASQKWRQPEHDFLCIVLYNMQAPGESQEETHTGKTADHSRIVHSNLRLENWLQPTHW
jgi:hypothetical protein